MSMINVGLVQINNSFSGQNYLPYSIACLESYLREHCANRDQLNFLPHIYKRAPINEIVTKMLGANIVGFSTYVWNAQISLEVARRIKAIEPETLIVFGGPQVPDKPEAFLRENEFIDIVVHNEGERTFANLVEIYPSRNWETMTGISYLDNSDVFQASMPTPRMRDLSELPSPFMNGIFDNLVNDNPDEKWIGLWETNRGCPFRCTFCDWGSATAAKVTKFEDERLESELKWMAEKRIEYIFVCDANFGIQKRDVEIAESVAKIKSETGFPQGFSVQNTKNATERAYLTQKIIADAGLNKGVALSMQSLDPKTLENIKRDNISLESYWELARRFTKDKVETYSDLILPLPGETYSSFCKGVDDLIRAGQHNRIQFNNLSILPNAEMGDPEYLQKHGMKVIRSEIINVHGSRVELGDDVPEFQELVVATATMGGEDWRKARSFAWMASFLHFDKLFQIPIIIALKNSDVTFTEIMERFMFADADRYPVVSSIMDFFVDEARKIGEGGAEYVYSDDWLGIYWPADEYMFIKLTAEDKMDRFYSEAQDLIASLVTTRNPTMPLEALEDAVKVNKMLVSQPFASDVLHCNLRYNVMDFWNDVREGLPANLVVAPTKIVIDRTQRSFDDLNEWCREVVWWGNKKGAYLYNGEAASEQLAGHF